MILLHNGCSMSTPAVNPRNWKTCGKAALTRNWYITYRFYDPTARDRWPKGRLIKVQGMNHLSTLEDRRTAVEALLRDIVSSHRDEGYNPITGVWYVPPEVEYEIHPDTPLIRALDKALEKVRCGAPTRKDIRNTLTWIKKSAASLDLDRLPIGKVRRKHIRLILDNCGAIKANWTPNMFNNYRKYLSVLFKELVELEAVDTNPVRDVAKMVVTQKIRQTMTMEERRMVDEHLRTANPAFWRYMHIFFHSGRRSAELLKVKREDVDLPRQRFKVVDRKGNREIERWCAIKTIALPLWTEIVQQARPGEYIFSEGLVPGPKLIRYDQITRRWQKWVKAPLGITADFYSLKHSNADDIARLHSIETAQGFIGHSSSKTTRIYATGQAERDLEAAQKISNAFAGGGE